MEDHAEQLRTALYQCEAFCYLAKWEQAENVLDALPDELRATAEVYEGRLEIYVGTKSWFHALILAEGLVSVFPDRAGPRFRLACIRAQLGNLEGAKKAMEECSRLEPEMRLQMLTEPLLSGMW